MTSTSGEEEDDVENLRLGGIVATLAFVRFSRK
jgi:hypothetical protein